MDNKKQNVLFWVGVNSKEPYLAKKHGNFEYFKYSKECWQIWCAKNDVVFFEYNTPTHNDHLKHKPTWQRWFDVFPQIEAAKINYNKIALIDGSTLCRLDTPNFFNLCQSGTVTGFRALENLRWVSEGVNGYKELFSEVNFQMDQYVSCGFQIFDKTHKAFLESLENFYFKSYEGIMKLQNEKVKRGTDQPVYNYLLQKHNIKVDTTLPKGYMLTHLSRFDWLSYNWQLNQDRTPFFLKYGYIYFFSGFTNRSDREHLMKESWNIIKNQL